LLKHIDVGKCHVMRKSNAKDMLFIKTFEASTLL